MKQKGLLWYSSQYHARGDKTFQRLHVRVAQLMAAIDATKQHYSTQITAALEG